MKKLFLILTLVILAAMMVTVGSAAISTPATALTANQVVIGPSLDPNVTPIGPLPRYRVAATSGSVIFNIPGQFCANDFHLEGRVLSRYNNMPVLSQWVVADTRGNSWRITGNSVAQDPNNPIYWNISIDFKTDGCLRPGDMLVWGIEYQQNYCNAWVTADGWLTRNGVRLSSFLGTGIPSFEVPFNESLNAFEDVLILSNKMEKDVVRLSEIEVSATDQKVELYQMNEKYLGRSGQKGAADLALEWIPIHEEVVLKPGETVKYDLRKLGIEMKEGRFLNVRAVDANGNMVFIQHEG